MRIHGERRPVRTALAAAAFLIAAVPAAADVTVNRKTTFDGIGQNGVAASEGTDTVIISGDKMRTEGTTKFTGKFLKHFGPKEGSRTATIVRLDRKLIYSIDYDEKSYYEMTFEQMRQMQEQAAQALKDAQAQSEPQARPQEEPEITCKPIQVDSKATGETATVAGRSTSRTTVKGTQNCENVKTKQTCAVIYTFDGWYTKDMGPFSEYAEFGRKAAEAMGYDMQKMKESLQAVQALFEGAAGGYAEMMKAVGAVGGYPMKNRAMIEKTGNCGWAESESGGQEMKDMKAAFKSMFGKKKQEGEAPPAAAGAGAPVRIFGTYEEVTAIATGAAPADSFDPPAGFKKMPPPELRKPEGK